MRFKTGDKVRIRKDLSAFGTYKREDTDLGLSVNSFMIKHKGQIATVADVHEEGHYYTLKEFPCCWSVGMFDNDYCGYLLDKDEWNNLMRSDDDEI